MIFKFYFTSQNVLNLTKVLKSFSGHFKMEFFLAPTENCQHYWNYINKYKLFMFGYVQSLGQIFKVFQMFFWLESFSGHFKRNLFLAPNRKFPTLTKYFGFLKVQNFQIWQSPKLGTFFGPNRNISALVKDFKNLKFG